MKQVKLRHVLSTLRRKSKGKHMLRRVLIFVALGVVTIIVLIFVGEPVSIKLALEKMFELGAEIGEAFLEEQ